MDRFRSAESDNDGSPHRDSPFLDSGAEKVDDDDPPFDFEVDMRDDDMLGTADDFVDDEDVPKANRVDTYVSSSDSAAWSAIDDAYVANHFPFACSVHG